MLSTTNLALLGVALLLVGLLLKRRRDRAAKAGGSRPSSSPKRRGLAKPSLSLSLPMGRGRGAAKNAPRPSATAPTPAPASAPSGAVAMTAATAAPPAPAEAPAWALPESGAMPAWAAAAPAGTPALLGVDPVVPGHLLEHPASGADPTASPIPPAAPAPLNGWPTAEPAAPAAATAPPLAPAFDASGAFPAPPVPEPVTGTWEAQTDSAPAVAAPVMPVAEPLLDDFGFPLEASPPTTLPTAAVPAPTDPLRGTEAILDDFGFPVEASQATTPPTAAVPAPTDAVDGTDAILDGLDFSIAEPLAPAGGGVVAETGAEERSGVGTPTLDDFHFDVEEPAAVAPVAEPPAPPVPDVAEAGWKGSVEAAPEPVAAPTPPHGVSDPLTVWMDLRAYEEPVEPRPEQRGRFALGGHALRTGQEALTGVTFRQPVDDRLWLAASGEERAALIALELEGAVNCDASGVEVVVDPGFAPTEEGFTVRLVAERAGPFMASGAYRLLP